MWSNPLFGFLRLCRGRPEPGKLPQIYRYSALKMLRQAQQRQKNRPTAFSEG
jgi:hypothetical protein